MTDPIPPEVASPPPPNDPSGDTPPSVGPVLDPEPAPQPQPDGEEEQ